MKSLPLGEIVDFHSGGTPSKSQPEFWVGDVPWFSAKDMKRPRLVDSADHISEKAFTTTRLRKLPAGTIAMVVRGMILAHTVPISILEVDAAINQDLKALLPKREVVPSFLAAMLRAQHTAILAQVSTAAHGTKKLESRVLEAIQIPMPSLAEQCRIAGILDHAEALRAKRRQLLTHIDALTQAVFHGMFGALTECRWSRVPLGEVVGEIESGTSPNCEARPAREDEIGVLKLGAVTYGVFRAHQNKAYLGEVGSMRANEVRPGDVLMTRKNTQELVGAVALVGDVRPGLLLPDLVFRLHLDPARVDPHYFQALMMHPSKRSSVRRLSSGSAGSMPNISKARLRSLELELPPLEVQREYAARSGAISTHRSAVETGMRLDDELFASLQSAAFRGEL